MEILKPEVGILPDHFALVKWEDGTVSVLSSWGGGYAYGESWRLSTPLADAKESETGFYATTGSGSVYDLRAPRIALHGMAVGIWSRLKEETPSATLLDTEEAVREALLSLGEVA